ncbi:MAG TPA: HAD family phosphatase, partial [Terriglobales bacterium]|nr:HAD family phosphatase [Terriglobales bacterium]
MPGVIFDLDGVLIDSEGLQYKAYSRVLAQWQIAVTKEQYAEHWIAAGRGPEYAAANLGMPISADELRDLKHPVYHDILCREVTLMPAALAALERLSAEFPMALATNSNKLDVDFVMERFGLRRFFQHLVGREDYLGAKPMPDAFLTAAERLGLPPSQCVVIEDAHKGILAAHRA